MTEDEATALSQRITTATAVRDEILAAMPDSEVAASIEAARGLHDVVRAALSGYASRPALGERTTELRTDPTSGRTSMALLPSMSTISYAELWERVSALAGMLSHPSHGGVRAGDRVCMVGFTSIDYTIVDLALMVIGAIAVPLQTNAPVTSLRPIVDETDPVLIACSIDTLEDASQLIATHPAAQLLVFDIHLSVDAHRDAVTAAREQLCEQSPTFEVMTLPSAISIGRRLPTSDAQPPDSDDALALLLYTSGSTGSPKGAMYTAALIANMWKNAARSPAPFIILSFMPMSHMLGRGTLYMSLASGGTAYFAAKSDLSTFFEDLALVRPTQLHFVPRIWDMLFHEYQRRVAQRAAGDTDPGTAEAEARKELRENVIGGRSIVAITASAPISPELRAWVESMLEMPLREAYGSTEVRGITIDGRVQRPPVIDYRLADVPELGYFSTDRPHPRGELHVKSVDTVEGYYKRPDLTAEMWDAEGWYHTGDIVAEIGPDQLAYVDRRNNVLKLSQGEFVALSKLETVYSHSPLVHQIFVYANSARAYLLAVIVPTEEALAAHGVAALKPLLSASLKESARAAGLQSYEVPRDLIIETTPFTHENGLLTGIRKLAWPKLKERYGPALEQLYSDISDGQTKELNGLRRDGADQPTLETVHRAAAALLGSATSDVPSDAQFTDLGGDSLSALTFADLLEDIYDVEVPVSVIVSPANDLQALATYIDARRQPGTQGPTFTSVHGRGASVVRASDLSLEKFLDEDLLSAAPSLPKPTATVRCVLLTGATGFLGRYLLLEWLERMDLADGTVICLVRGKDETAARTRLEATFDSGDENLLARYQRLAADHLDVVNGDKGETNLGLDEATWRRLAERVDLIVDPAALVNHVLPYSQLFGPNVAGTAELIRLALTSTLKPIVHVSTVAVGMQIEAGQFVEDADIRQISPSRTIDDGYANGYANSKWAGEVLLREAHQLCGLPVTVFRSNMILAEPTYLGQLNVPDMVTRLILSVVASGIAPTSFYQRDSHGDRQPAHYDGLPVDFIAQSIAEIGAQNRSDHLTYHVMNPHEDGIGLDVYVDWLIEAGIPIRRVDDYQIWRSRFETVLRGLPESQRQGSLLPLMLAFREPLPPTQGSAGPTDKFRAAVQDAKIGPEQDIPHITPSVINKYVTDLRHLGLL